VHFGQPGLKIYDAFIKALLILSSRSFLSVASCEIATDGQKFGKIRELFKARNKRLSDTLPSADPIATNKDIILLDSKKEVNGKRFTSNHDTAPTKKRKQEPAPVELRAVELIDVDAEPVIFPSSGNKVDVGCRGTTTEGVDKQNKQNKPNKLKQLNKPKQPNKPKTPNKQNSEKQNNSEKQKNLTEPQNNNFPLQEHSVMEELSNLMSNNVQPQLMTRHGYALIKYLDEYRARYMQYFCCPERSTSSEPAAEIEPNVKRIILASTARPLTLSDQQIEELKKEVFQRANFWKLEKQQDCKIEGFPQKAFLPLLWTLILNRIANTTITPEQSLQMSLSYLSGSPLSNLAHIYSLPPAICASSLAGVLPRGICPRLQQEPGLDTIYNAEKCAFWTPMDANMYGKFTKVRARILAALGLTERDLAAETTPLRKLLEFLRAVELVDPYDGATYPVNWLYVEDVFGCTGYFDRPLLNNLRSGPGGVVWMHGWANGFQIHPKIVNFTQKQFKFK